MQDRGVPRGEGGRVHDQRQDDAVPAAGVRTLSQGALRHLNGKRDRLAKLQFDGEKDGLEMDWCADGR